jgi:hypothetical protein
MTTTNLGNDLYSNVTMARNLVLASGESARLTYGSLSNAADSVMQSDLAEHVIEFPIGWNADHTPMMGTRNYQKDALANRYQQLAGVTLPLNGIVHLVVIMEAMLSEIVRAIVRRYPHKLGSKRTIALESVLDSTSMDEVYIRATDAVLHDLSYLSPKEFAEEFRKLTDISLLESAPFLKYLEIKATRDVCIHNQFIANVIYERKAGSHRRVKAGMKLPIDIQYFMESYETCLQLTEWLEEELHERWHSSERDDWQARQLEMKLPKPNTNQP